MFLETLLLFVATKLLKNSVSPASHPSQLATILIRDEAVGIFGPVPDHGLARGGNRRVNHTVHPTDQGTIATSKMVATTAGRKDSESTRLPSLHVAQIKSDLNVTALPGSPATKLSQREEVRETPGTSADALDEWLRGTRQTPSTPVPMSRPKQGCSSLRPHSWRNIYGQSSLQCQDNRQMS